MEKVQTCFDEIGNLESIHSTKYPIQVTCDNLFLTYTDDAEEGCVCVIEPKYFRCVNKVKLKEPITSFLPHPSNRTILVSTISHALLEIDYRTGKLLKSLKTTHKQPVNRMCFNDSGTRLVTGASDGEVRIRHMGIEESIIRVCIFHQGKILMLKCSPTHPILISSSLLTNDIGVWDINSGALKANLQGHQDTVTDADFKGDLLVSCGRDKVIILWNISSLQKVSIIPTLESSEACCFLSSFGGAVEENDQLILTCSLAGGHFRLWSQKEKRNVCSKYNLSQTNKYSDSLLNCVRQLVRLPKSRGHMFEGETVHESDMLMMIRENGTLQFWREKDFLLFCEFTLNFGEVRNLAICGSNKDMVLVTENSCFLRLFPRILPLQKAIQHETEPISWHCSVLDACSGKEPRSHESEEDHNVDPGESSVVLDVAVSPNDPSIVASVGKDCCLSLWSVKSTESLLRPVELVQAYRVHNAHDKHITAVTFSHDGNHLFTACVDFVFKRWIYSPEKPQSVSLSCKINAAHSGIVNQIVCSPDNAYVATASKDKSIKIWKNCEKMSALQCFKGHRRGVWSIAFSPSEKKLVSVSADQSVKVWSIDSGQQLLSLQEEAKIYRTLFRSSGREVFTVNENGEVTLCPLDPKKANSLLAVFNCDQRLSALCLSNDEKTIFVGGENGTIHVLKDVTHLKRVEAKQKKESEVKTEQELSNLMLMKAYPDALIRAVQLDRPKTALTIIETILQKEDDAEFVLNAAFSDLNTANLDQLMQYSLRWMNRNRTEKAAHLIQNFVFSRHNMGKIAEKWQCLKNKSIIDVGIQCAERASNRLDNTLSLLGRIDFIAHAMPRSQM